jgi:hypothetical protein
MEIMLSELKYGKDKILSNPEWKVVDVGKYKDHRLFYKNDEDRSGFEFISVRYCGGDKWTDYTEVEILFSGVAYWDGIRHIWFGDEDTETDPYWYSCEDMQEYIDLFQELQNLTKIHCRAEG